MELYDLETKEREQSDKVLKTLLHYVYNIEVTSIMFIRDNILYYHTSDVATKKKFSPTHPFINIYEFAYLCKKFALLLNETSGIRLLQEPEDIFIMAYKVILEQNKMKENK